MDNFTLVFSFAIVVLIYLVVVDSKRTSVAASMDNESNRNSQPCLPLGSFRYLNKPSQGPGSMTDNIGVPPSPGVMQGVIRRLEDDS